MALRRAAHQLWDRPLVFHDPLALPILGARPDGSGLPDLRAPKRRHSSSLRAYLVARSRFAEDAVQAAAQPEAGTQPATATPVEQYVLLGAGLDTFAYRNPIAALRVFEVDHPATQAWKLQLLHAAGIAIPPSATHVSVDFLTESLSDRLATAGFHASRPACFAWLGVVPYLSNDAFAATLRYLSGCAPGSVLLLDYGLPRSALAEREQREFDSLAARVAAAGEPFQSWFVPEQMHGLLSAGGWQVEEDLGRDAINDRYFTGRDDGLRCLGNGGRLLRATLRGRE